MGIARRIDTPPPAGPLVRTSEADRRLDITTPFRVSRTSQRRSSLLEDQAVVVDTGLDSAPPPETSPQTAAARQILKLPQPSWLLAAAIAATVGFVVWWVMFERLPDIDPQQVISTHLASARRAYDEQRYVEPVEHSALHHYSTVLALDPANATARSGIDRIADHYAQDAKAQLAGGRLADAALAIERARRLQPAHPQLLKLDEQMRAALSAIVAAARTSESETTSAVPAAGPAARPERGVSKESRLAQKDAVPQSIRDEAPRSAQRAPTPQIARLDTARRLIAEAQTGLDAPRPNGMGPTASRQDSEVAAAASAPRRIIKLVQPQYPGDARMRGIEGWVDVNVVVTPSGDVLEQNVVASSRGRVFERAALNAVRQWKYEPRATNDTERLQVRVDFRMEKQD
jgi:protein TonB